MEWNGMSVWIDVRVSAVNTDSKEIQKGLDAHTISLHRDSTKSKYIATMLLQ